MFTRFTGLINHVFFSRESPHIYRDPPVLSIIEVVPTDSITMKDFNQMDMRIVMVVKAERIPGATKILKLTVDMGGGNLRTMITGGAEFYKPDYFENKKFIALVNLAPKRISGIESQGMLLAADLNGKPVWLIVDGDAPVGTRVR
jgi:methionine--tRNA ligase beta chain